MKRLEITIRTLAPIVLSSAGNSTVMTKTNSTMSGSIIRGILASRFVAEQKISDEAHDETFREIFFGGLRFLPANPEIKNQRSFVLPLSLQSGKAGTPNGDKVQDLLDNENPPRGYKNFRGFGILDDKKFFSAQVKTSIFMHMSRNSDNERLLGRSVEGQIYNYEAIDAEQNFRGEIIGDEEILRKLRDGLNLDGGKMIAYIGRSKFTQYGKCLVTFGEIEPLPAQDFSDKIYLRLDTPLIPAEDYFIGAEKILAAEVVDVLGEKFSLGKVFASGVEIENFVVPWGMKRPRVSALAAGTVFELKISAPLSDTEKKILAEKISGGFGMRTEEGFGQMRPWFPSKDFTKGKIDSEEIPKPESFSDETIARAKKILTAHLLEQTRIFAHEHADKIAPQLKFRGNMAHFFTRLGGILDGIDKKNLRQNLKARLEIELRDGSQFEEHLKNLSMANGQKFFDVLTCAAPLPIDEVDLKIAALPEELKFSAEDSRDEIHLEYLKNYFRFARKVAVKSKAGENS